MMLKKFVAIPLAGAILSAAWVGAQDNQDPAQPRSGKPGQVQPQSKEKGQTGRAGLAEDRAGWNNTDQTLASVSLIQNQEEVALATMAQDKLQNEEAKQFATMMIEQHQAYLTKLEKFAPEAAGHQLDSGKQPSQVKAQAGQKKDSVERANVADIEGRPGIQQTAGTETERTAKPAQGVDMLQIHREIAQECLTAATAEMQKKQGIEADQCFLGFQIAKHGAMKAQLTVFQRHASPELAQVFAEGAATAEKHMNEAEAIMKSLSSDDKASARRNERKETREEKRDNK